VKYWFKTDIIYIRNKHIIISALGQQPQTNMTTPFELMYRKNKHARLFESLEKANTGLQNLQNYIPMYRRFFSLSESNHESINLNHAQHVALVAPGANKHTVVVTLEREDETNLKVPAFIKYSPLLDPVKYLSGKYEIDAADLLALPKYESVDADISKYIHQKKTNDINNSSYVDSFFTYLTSRALHIHDFVHGLDFYGSFLANQREFTVNVYDELEYFSSCDFFLKNQNKLFALDEIPSVFFNAASNQANKSKSNAKSAVRIGEELDADAEHLHLDSESVALHAFDDLFVPSESDALDANAPVLEFELAECVIAEPDKEPESIQSNQLNQSGTSNSSDSCSSRSSDDDDTDDDEVDDNDVMDDGNCMPHRADANDDDACTDSCSGTDNDESGDDDSECNDEDEVHNAHIFNFPVNAIIMEKCDNTLDSLMCGKNEMTEPEWAATLMQVIMTLIAYQHMFAFTHNDLHTNNIMFVKTDKKFLHYLHKGTYYRVPTHGRIMKIIDFGRAIYKYRGQTMVSDSFDRHGDAATQYNCEPYMNPRKPRLDPNPSFDLCRLACSLFDYFVEDIRDEAEYAATLKESRIASMVAEWLKDDKGRNVLYKKNGDERYPEFKLYKMIARTVHGAVPHEQLRKPMFAHYAIPRKQIKGKPHIMNIDTLPCYCAST
jgi:hypothetical protein